MSELLPFQGRPDAEDPASWTRFARVVVERGIESAPSVEAGRAGGRDGLTYAAPGSEFDGLIVGERVMVPLGRGSKPAGGVVVAVGGAEILDGLDPRKVKPMMKRTRPGEPVLTPTLIELAQWIAAYTITPLGIVIGSMTPAAVKHSVGRKTRTLLTPAGTPEMTTLTPSVRAAWDAVRALDASVWPASKEDVQLAIVPEHRRAVARLVSLGLLVQIKSQVVVERGDSASVELSEADHARRSFVPVLTGEQEAVVASVAKDLDSGRFAVHLLHGVTGSGKTEVYLNLIGRVLDLGKSALVLVPEIALTPQVESWFRARLGGRGVDVAVLHSGLTASRRHAQWERVMRGESRVIVGPRSALFAPARALGLIVVDEEHDGSYKHEQAPRYNGRDAALKRGQLEGCPVVLGSATPSMESWSNATIGPGGEPARYVLHRLRTRPAGAGRMPQVRIVDMAAERRVLVESGECAPSRAFLRVLGPTLVRELEATIRAGGQAILLLNRRGFAGHLACRNASCGWAMSCESCDAGMVFHKDRTLPKGGLVRCHHCLAEQLMPAACAVCRGPVAMFGTGTQRAEEELVEVLTSRGVVAPHLRVDSDSMTSGADYARALERFASGEVSIMLGTQMIAKGLDFPNVRLVGVLSADIGLNMPDFRAAERTFQLVSQVAGRAGRGAEPGLVIVQTMFPDNPTIIQAALHDYAGFAADELACRRSASLPPAWRMARIVCRHKKSDAARDRAGLLATVLRSTLITGRVEGPAEAPIARLSDHYRWEVAAFAPTASILHSALATLRAQGLLRSDAETAVDVDPQTLL